MKISKKILAVLLAALMLCSGMAVTAFAEKTYTTVADLFTFDLDEKALSVKITVDGKEFVKSEATFDVYLMEYKAPAWYEDKTVTIGETLFDKQENAVINVTGLKAGKAYTIVVNITDKDENEKKCEKEFKILKERTAPANMTATVGLGTLTVEKVDGYSIVLKDKKPQANGKNLEFMLDVIGIWGETYEWKDLEGGKQHTVSVRYAETDEYSASGAFSLTKTIQKANTTKPAAPVISNVTKTSITVTKVANAKYSKDAGTTWQDSNEFTGLTSGQTYSICIKKVDPTGVQTDSPASDIVKIRTNNGDTYKASKNDIKITGITDKSTVKSGQAISITANTVKRASGADQWGDTRLVPVSIIVGTASGATFKDGKASVTPSANDNNKTVEATILYSVQTNKGTWVETGTETIKYSVTVLDAGSSLLRSLVDVFVVTLPSIFTKIINFMMNAGVSFLGLLTKQS